MAQLNKRFLLFCFAVLAYQLSVAGGWPQPKKSGFFQLSERWLISNEHFTDKGLIDPNVTTGLAISSFYGEYGLTNKLTVRAYVPFLVSNFQNNIISGTRDIVIQEGKALNSFGDIIIGADHLLYKTNTISTTVGVSIGLATGTIGQGEKQNLQTGDGENNITLRFDIGTAIYNTEKLNIYGKGGIGFNKRSNDFSDEIRSQVEVGVIYKKNYYFIQKLFNVYSLQNGVKSGKQISNAGVFANNAEFNAYEAIVAANIYKGYHLSFAVNHILNGKIVAAGTAFEIGVFKKFK